MLTVARRRVCVPLPTSDVRFEPAYVVPLLHIKYRSKLAELPFPIQVDEIPAQFRGPTTVAHNFATIEEEIRRLRVEYNGVSDEFGRHAVDAAYPEGVRRAIMDEVEAYEAKMEETIKDIDADPEVVALQGMTEPLAKALAAFGYPSVASIGAADPEVLASLPDISLTKARKLVKAASKGRFIDMSPPPGAGATVTGPTPGTQGITSHEAAANSRAKPQGLK